MKPTVYALYKGDEFLDMGTAYQLAKRRGVTPKTIRWMATPTCHKRNRRGRTVAVKVVDE